MSADLLWQIGAAVVSAAAVYGGIRSDLKAMHERISLNERAIERMHERMDSCLGNYGRRRDD